ncbi:MAG: 4Fe-4S dicluster domain-containing protein [Deltaproteobacteria bacterium]|nr:4Fe-4S dicluster domain-containing protein [Deltaproteobacteria bacterium]
MAREVLKAWPQPGELHLPLDSKIPEKGLKPGKNVAYGQLLARSRKPLVGHLRAPAAGEITALEPGFVTLVPGSAGTAAPPPALDITSLKGPDLKEALLDLGLKLPPNPRPGEKVVISGLDPEPDLGLAGVLWSEWPQIMADGLETVKNLYPDNDLLIARPPELICPENYKSRLVSNPYPYTLPPFLKTVLGFEYELTPKAFFDSRTVYLLGQTRRQGRPPGLWPMTVQTQNYLVPPGLRPRDILKTVSLEPLAGDAVVLGGLRRGRPTARLDDGLGPEVISVHLVRARFLGPRPGPCRRCGSCRRVCPLNLPIDSLTDKPLSSWPDLISPAREILISCPDCGQCSLACPANRPLRVLTSPVP